MFLGLRHPAVVRSHHQECEIDRAQSGDHVADEIFMPGNIDDAEEKPGSARCAKPRSIVMPRAFSSGNRSVSTAGERFDQGGLAVIDVTGGRENEMLHACYFVRHAVKAATTSSSCSWKIVRRSSWNRPRAR